MQLVLRFRSIRLGLIAAAVGGVSVVTWGQAPAAGASGRRLMFEVSSIRRNTVPNTGPAQVGPTADGFQAIGLPLIGILQIAYAPSTEAGFLRGDRIHGAPDWMTGPGEHYDVVGKVSAEDMTDWRNPAKQQAMLREMLKNLMIDRCKLAAHMESKELPVYDLVLAKGGPKFRQSEITDAAELKAKHPGGGAIPGGGLISPGPNGVSIYGVTMAMLGQGVLSGFAGRPVVDKTGLTGRYDILIPQTTPGGNGPNGPVEQNPEASIFTELPEKLGLRLEPDRARVDTLVIDHVERPSDN